METQAVEFAQHGPAAGFRLPGLPCDPGFRVAAADEGAQRGPGFRSVMVLASRPPPPIQESPQCPLQRPAGRPVLQLGPHRRSRGHPPRPAAARPHLPGGGGPRARPWGRPHHALADAARRPGRGNGASSRIASSRTEELCGVPCARSAASRDLSPPFRRRAPWRRRCGGGRWHLAFDGAGVAAVAAALIAARCSPAHLPLR